MINSITLGNFKCFEALTSIPMSRFTFLYGKNGRGKSSVIQSLLLLSQSLRENGGVLNSLILNGKMVSLGTFDDIRNRYSDPDSPIQITVATDSEAPLELSFTRSVDKPTIADLDDIWVGDVHYISAMEAQSQMDPEAVVSKEEGSPGGMIVLSQSDINTYSILKTLAFVAADRRGPVNFEPRRDNLGPADVDVRGDNLINSLSVKSSDFLERFSQELSLILSGASIRVFPNPVTPDRLELFLDSVNNNEQGFRPRNVGFGYSYVLPIIYQTLTAPKGGMVVVENPEAHLYPGAQSRLVDFLVKYANLNNLQILLETHSDHIINGLRISVKNGYVKPNETSVLFFDRDDENSGTPIIETISIDSRGALSSQPRDFMDEWTRQMLELM